MLAILGPDNVSYTWELQEAESMLYTSLHAARSHSLFTSSFQDTRAFCTEGKSEIDGFLATEWWICCTTKGQVYVRKAEKTDLFRRPIVSLVIFSSLGKDGDAME